MKKRSILLILFIAVLMLSTACSSSGDPVTVPDDNTNGSGSVKTVTEVPDPTFASQESNGVTSVKIFVSTVGAQIFYSTDGSSYQQYSAPITIDESVTIYAYAEVDGVKSKTVSADFYVEGETYDEPSENEDVDDSIHDSLYTDDDTNVNTDNNDIDDDYGDSSDENLPEYGTYAYKPAGQIPFFDELTLDDLFSSESEMNKKLDEIAQAHKAFCVDNNREYEALDPSSVGSTPKTLWGIYYKVTDSDNDRVPFDQVETWLVMFEGGVYAFYDNNFKHVLSCGALMHEPDNDWQTFTVDENGDIDVLWEFNGNDISSYKGYFIRAFELWDYDSEDAGSSGITPTGNTGTDDAVSEYLTVDPITEFFTMDRSLFGLSYKEFCNKLGRNDLMQPEEWPWWGNDLEVVYVDGEYDTFACFFQNNSLVTVYRDSPSDVPGEMYYGATLSYGDPDTEYEYWNGTPAYAWILSDCSYQQYVESYSEGEQHYRQQYYSFDYEE